MEGRFDGVVQEIDAQEMKNMSGKAIFEYPKFKMSEVAMMFARERVQQQNLLTFAAPSQELATIATNDEHELPPQAHLESEPEEEQGESSRDRKERILKEARVKHVTSAMNQQLRLVVRPNTKSDYADLLKESALIQNRSSLSSLLLSHPSHTPSL